MLLHLDDLPLDPPDAEGLRELAEILGIDAGIEVICVAHLERRSVRELVALRRLQLQAVVAELGLNPNVQAAQPEMMELAEPRRLTVASERVDISIGAVAPAFEGDA